MRLRALRTFWPLAFIAPLWLLLDRFCWSMPDHVVLHTTMLLHENLPAIVALAATVSILVIAVKLARVNSSLRTLRAIAGPLPEVLRRTVVNQATALSMREPPVIYLDVATPICYTVLPGPAILISRGFIEELSGDDLELVVRHELVHVRRHDPLRGLLWHLLFSALLIPGFGDLERWLYDRRERRANQLAGSLDRDRYAVLEARVRYAEHAFERSLGHAYAGALTPQHKKRTSFVFVRPVLAATVFGALFVSHAVFMHSLPFLQTHHC
jgi:Zn-dependent protease with chaperone function